MRPLIGTSLKMNLTSTEAATYFDAVRAMVAALSSCELFVLPPFTSIWVAREHLRGSNVAWGAQDVHAEEGGAHTGDVSARMLADLECSFVEVGHSERRRDHGETDEMVARKVRQILDHDMTPIMCVGEPEPMENESALDHVLGQARTGLGLVPESHRHRAVIAYEPVWAIGEGAAAADPTHIGAVHRGLHALGTRVIYGGSVDQLTAGPILAQDGVDGLFVGRAALDPQRFAEIAASTKR
ncbi:MAG TPA: triose-phosphate isomerase [Candidatus Dormibacteraeota bacterium]|nr:triose-phosphate isomerase [Candidatus Dormibacteraeota bacterium]